MKFLTHVVTALLITFSACAPVTDERAAITKEDIATEEEVKAEETARTRKFKAYAMPSPLQFSSSLKNLGYAIEPLQITTTSNSYLSPEQAAINTGIRIVQIGNQIVYDQGSDMPALIKDLDQLSDQIGLTVHQRRGIAKRFNENSQSQDSLLRLVLEIYHYTQEELIEQRRDKSAVLLMAGCYLGGLQTCLNANGPNNTYYQKLVGHQKLYLKNLIQLANKQGDDPVLKGLIAQLDSLQDSFDQVQIDTRDPSAKPFRLKAPVSLEVLDSLRKHTEFILQGISGAGN